MNITPSMHYAVIGRSEGQPLLYHMNQTRERAERLRLRRQQAGGQPCFVVPMAAWHANPLVALQHAEAGRFGTITELSFG